MEKIIRNDMITRPEVQLDKAMQQALQYESECCTILHCSHKIILVNALFLTISPSTFLVQDNGTLLRVITAFNIQMFPKWTEFSSQNAKFTLVFEGLSKSCKKFHLMESITGLPHFFTEDIIVNSSGVYTTELFSSDPF